MWHTSVLKGGELKHGHGRVNLTQNWSLSVIMQQKQLVFKRFDRTRSDSPTLVLRKRSNMHILECRELWDGRFGGSDCCSDPLCLGFLPPPTPPPLEKQVKSIFKCTNEFIKGYWKSQEESKSSTRISQNTPAMKLRTKEQWFLQRQRQRFITNPPKN